MPRPFTRTMRRVTSPSCGLSLRLGTPTRTLAEKRSDHPVATSRSAAGHPSVAGEPLLVELVLLGQVVGSLALHDALELLADHRDLDGDQEVHEPVRLVAAGRSDLHGAVHLAGH